MYESMLKISPTLSDQSKSFIQRSIAIAEFNKGLNLMRLARFEQAPGSPIIHLATHGYNRLDAPNFSSVLLAV